MLLDLGLAEFSAGQPGWAPAPCEAAVAAAGDDATRTAAALLFATALRFHQRFAEAVEVCDRVAARLDDRDAEARWMFESMAVACGMNDAATAPSVADRADALVVLAREQSVPRQVLAVAAFRAALANEPAERAAELARRAVAAGPRPLPDPDDGPWFPIAVQGAVLGRTLRRGPGTRRRRGGRGAGRSQRAGPSRDVDPARLARSSGAAIS